MMALFLVLSLLLGLCAEIAAGSEETIKEKYVIPITNINVRTGPSTKYSIILHSTGASGGTMGMLMKYQSTVNGWYKVLLPEGTEAYVNGASEYCELHEFVYTRTEYENYCQVLKEAGFPESYWQKLFYLHLLYPNWIFRPLQTGLDWNKVITEESRLGYNLTYDFYPTSWKSTQSGAYNWETDSYISLDSGDWHQVSQKALAFCMDPRNWFGTASVFQFFSQSYDSKTQSRESLQELVDGTFLADIVTDTDGKELSYVDAIYNAGAEFGINPYVLAAMIVQEQGVRGGGNCISGTHSKYPGYFNFFNIGAYASGGMDAVERGLWYASGGTNGAATSYQRPWKTRNDAIRGGAEWYAEGYINAGQNTLYLKKFNVQGSRPFTHQYMTNLTGAISESATLSKGYDEKMRSLPLLFSIPVYENMPDGNTVPIGTGSPNNRLKSITVNGKALSGVDSNNIGDLIVGADITEAVISAVPCSSSAGITGTGTLKLKDGNNTVTLTVTAANGDVRTYSFVIAKEASPEPEPGGEEPPYPVTEGWMLVPLGTTAEEFLAKWPSSAWTTVELLTSAGEPADTAGRIGSGMKVRAVGASDGTETTYTLVVAGDVNGDGQVSNTDRIRIRNHILGSGTLSGAGLIAADVNRDGRVTNTDRIRVRNYILGTGTLN